MIFDEITTFYIASIMTAWIISCIIKMILYSYSVKKIDFLSGFKNGGMPSSHTALISSTTLAIFLTEGLSPILFLAIVVSTLIIRDAVTVRREVGIIGDEINKMLDKKIKVVHGHTMPQVIIGGIIGITSTLIFYVTIL